MSLSHASAEDDGPLVRYLLDLIPEDERERLDELAIADDDFAARLRDAENDLIDAYVRDLLDVATQARFETIYLATPARRQRVRFAQSFFRMAGAPPTPDASVTAPPARPKLRWYEPLVRLASAMPLQIVCLRHTWIVR